MSVRFQDYYKSLGVSREAGQDEIKKAYRRLARKYHPDVSKVAGAADQFKKVAEAYEVLGDPEKRRKYDELGNSWRSGQEFTPPRGWDQAHDAFRGAPREGGFSFDDIGGASDFFEALFGGRRAGRVSTEDDGNEGYAHGEDHEAEITISIEEAFSGVRKGFRLQTPEIDRQGRVHRALKRYDVNIPAGTAAGARIRLAGQGGGGFGRGASGDLYLRVSIAPQPGFRLVGRDLEMHLPVSPWEAALGARVSARAPDGEFALTIPPGTQSGQRLRLRGHGLPGQGRKSAGDLLVEVKILVPTKLSAKERELFEELARHSAFNPRP